MKIIEKSKEKLVFIEDMGESLANAIRRSCLEVPVLAIDEVEFYKNDSALYDEVLALRLGLLPLITEKGFKLREECSCKGKGCMKCSAQLKLKAKGPCAVYAKELKGKVDVVYDEMPIVYLSDEQELELVATIKLGKGIEHTKFSPGLVFYRNAVLCEKCAKKNSDKVIEKSDYDIFKCDMCGADLKDAEKFLGKEIVFSIESWGQLDAESILSGAIVALKDNLKIVEKA